MHWPSVFVASPRRPILCDNYDVSPEFGRRLPVCCSTVGAGVDVEADANGDRDGDDAR